MKNIPILLFLVYLIGLTANSALAQKALEFGVSVGAQNAYSGGLIAPIPIPAGYNRPLGLLVSASYSKKPNGLPFHIKGGLAYAYRQNSNLQSHLLALPVGIEFVGKKKWHPRVGLGLRPALVLAENMHEQSRLLTSRAILSSTFDLALGYRFSEKECFSIGLLGISDLSMYYEERGQSAGGGSISVASIHGYETHIRVRYIRLI